MNGITKNDLSFDEVKLDYKALITTAQVAVGRCIQEIERHKSEVHDALWKRDNTRLHLCAERLAEQAKLLSVCANTLAALNEGVTRSVVTIVNKDEVPEKE
jgi:hypothetical protein